MMKKTLLLLCAFMSSIGISMAQTNLASGKTVSVIYLPDSKTAPESDDLSHVTDGNTGTNVILPNTENDIAAISIDLTEADDNKQIGTISVVQDGRHATAYTIYGTNDAPTSYSTKDALNTAAASWTTLVSATNDDNAGGDTNIYTKPYTAASNSGFRYIIFVPTAQVYGVSLRQIYVYQYETPVLTTVSATPAAASLSVGDTQQITANAYDQFSNAFTATFTYESSNTAVATVSESGLITAVAAGTATITIKANNDKTATVNVTVASAFVMPAEAPTTPTDNSEDVLAVYSPTYSATTYTATNGAWNGGHDEYSVETVGGYNVLKSTHCGQFGLSLNKDVTAYKALHASIYVAVDYDGTVANDNTKIADISLKAGQWNYINVNIEGNSMSSLNYLMFNTGAKATQTVVITDIYFSKAEAVVPFNITENGVVTGDVKADNVAAINACTSAVINLTGANVKESISLTPANSNAVVVVNGTNRTPSQTVTATNLVVYQSPYYRAAEGHKITIVDSNDAQPNYGFQIDAQTDGYSISRTIPAKKYVTTVLPATIAAANLTDVDIYELTEASSSQLTFTKKETADLVASTPYVLYSESGATLTVEAKADLNLTSTEVGSYEKNSVTFKGTFAPITTNGTQYVLSDGEIAKGNGIKIGAFRAYFTGISAASARLLFVADGTTKVGTIGEGGTIEAGQAYNLSGQRVERPTKGLYIVNGKKVIVK